MCYKHVKISQVAKMDLFALSLAKPSSMTVLTLADQALAHQTKHDTGTHVTLCGCVKRPHNELMHTFPGSGGLCNQETMSHLTPLSVIWFSKECKFDLPLPFVLSVELGQGQGQACFQGS